MSVQIILRFVFRVPAAGQSDRPPGSRLHSDGFSLLTDISWESWQRAPDTERDHWITNALKTYPRNLILPFAVVYSDASFSEDPATWEAAVDAGAQSHDLPLTAFDAVKAADEADADMKSVFEGVAAMQRYHAFMAEYPLHEAEIARLTALGDPSAVAAAVSQIPQLADLVPILRRDRFFETMVDQYRLQHYLDD